MLSAPGELAEAPDGNGGMYVALRESGVLSRLQKEGVTGIFQFGVDNVRRARPAPRPALRPALRPCGLAVRPRFSWSRAAPNISWARLRAPAHRASHCCVTRVPSEHARAHTNCRPAACSCSPPRLPARAPLRRQGLAACPPWCPVLRPALAALRALLPCGVGPLLVGTTHTQANDAQTAADSLAFLRKLLARYPCVRRGQHAKPGGQTPILGAGGAASSFFFSTRAALAGNKTHDLHLQRNSQSHKQRTHGSRDHGDPVAFFPCTSKTRGHCHCSAGGCAAASSSWRASRTRATSPCSSPPPSRRPRRAARGSARRWAA